MRRLQDERGFTLIEALVTTVAMVIVLAALTDIFSSGLKDEVGLRNRVQAQEQARIALNELRVDAHQACTISNQSATSVTFNMPDPTIDLPCSAPTPVIWCTSASGPPYTLYNGASCPANGHVVATALASSNVFLYVPKSLTALAKIHVDLQLTSTSGRSSGSYRLMDDLVLLNS